jgi:hypothetical protein
MTPDEREIRLAELRRKRAASHMPNGSIAGGYQERVVAIDKEIARLEALDD